MARQFDKSDRCIYCNLLKSEHQKFRLSPTDWRDRWSCPDLLQVDRRNNEDPWDPLDVGEAPVAALFDPIDI